MDPPIVINADGQPWDKSKGIGDDSDVTCQVVVRNWKAPIGGKTGISIRLDSVRIDNLVEFTSKDWPEAVGDRVKALEEHKVNPWTQPVH
jgi:hypothetical protein